MSQYRVFVPWKFFGDLYPFSAELINGNAMIIRACGAKPDDGSILRSRDYLLFGNGMATLLSQTVEERNVTDGYTVRLFDRCVRPGVTCWEAQSVSRQSALPESWRLKVSTTEPDPDDEGHIRMLVQSDGNPGQYLYLARPA